MEELDRLKICRNPLAILIRLRRPFLAHILPLWHHTAPFSTRGQDCLTFLVKILSRRGIQTPFLKDAYSCAVEPEEQESCDRKRFIPELLRRMTSLTLLRNAGAPLVW